MRIDYETLVNVLIDKIKELETTAYVKELTIKELNEKMAKMESKK